MRLLLISLFLLMLTVPAHAQGTGETLQNVLNDFTMPDGPALVAQVSTPEGSWTLVGGLADGERATRKDDRFRIASMSKTFVAVVTLMLVEEGVLALDDPAHAWLPTTVTRSIPNAESVTIRQLLSMRSGIPDYFATSEFWEAVEDDPTYRWTAEEALEYVYDTRPLFAPDEDFEYSNSNYLLAQLVLENASGQPLYELVRERILDPLAMSNTYTQIDETLPGGFVSGYSDFDGDGEAEDVSAINDGAGLGDGGLISTTADLTTFYRALLAQRTLLGEDAMEELLAFGADSDYSLGLNVWETPWGDAWGHSGGVVGFLSIGVYIESTDTTIIVLSASETVAPEDVALALGEALLD